MTLTVGPALCLLQAVAGAGGLRSTPCNREYLAAGGVEKVEFTVLGLEPGDHTLTFTLKTEQGKKDILEKKLRVVVRWGGRYTTNLQTGLLPSQNLTSVHLSFQPEGQKQELLAGGTLDPQGLYGTLADPRSAVCSVPAAAQCRCCAAGSEKTIVVLKNRLPINIVPNTAVERSLSINGKRRGANVMSA